MALAGVASCDEHLGDPAGARAEYQRLVALGEAAGEVGLIAVGLEGLARAAVAAGDVAGAQVAARLRVLRPGGRMLMQIGMKWPDGPPKHMPHPRANVDVSDEDAVRRMVEDAGFGDISISYSPVFGEHRWANLVSRQLSGSDQVRLVGARRPEVATAG